MNRRWWWLAPMSMWLVAVTLAAHAAGVTQTGNPAGPGTGGHPDVAAGGTTSRRRPPATRAATPATSCHEDKADLAQRHAARAGEESALAGGGPRLRELPRPGPGARRRRRQRTHPEVRADQAGRDQPDVPGVPQPRQSRGMGGQRARAPQPLLHHLPQRAQPEIDRASAGQGDRDPALRHVPPAAGDQDRARRGAYAGARRQDVVQLLP